MDIAFVIGGVKDWDRCDLTILTGILSCGGFLWGGVE
jgi:hypothetical protein